MDEDEGSDPYPEGRSEDFPRVHEGGRLGARRDQGVQQVMVPRVAFERFREQECGDVEPVDGALDGLSAQLAFKSRLSRGG